MDVRTQRWIDRWLGVPICAALSLADALLPRRAPGPRVERILVILLSEMGALVLAYPMFARLKERYPGATIHALVFAKNREVLDLLGAVAPANVITLDDSSLGSVVRDGLRIVRELVRLKPDAVIDCELFARVSAILSFLSRAPLRAGFHRYTQEGLYRGSFINRPVLYNPYQHISRQFLALAAALDSDTVPRVKALPEGAEPQAPVLALPEEELRRFAARLEADFPQLSGKPLVLVYPSGGILPIRAWPIEHYRALCAGLLDDGHAVAIIGLPRDKALAGRLVAELGSDLCVDLAGYTRSVRELLLLLNLGALLVTNDGGPGQFAALAPIPAIVLFGPETPALYGPLASNVQSVHLAIPCSPCLTAYNHRTSPCDGDNQCLKRIAPESVLATARATLASRTAPSAARLP